MENFIGKDGFIWWIGVVEKRDDSATVGRYKVRIFGWHTDDLNVIPTDELPWAGTLKPVGGSNTFSAFREGDWVMGFFQDGTAGQSPVIFGAYESVQAEEPNRDKGFSPQGPTENVPKMPEGQINRAVGKPTTPPLARGVVSNTAIAVTNADLIHVCGFKSNFNVSIDLGLGELTAVKELATALDRGIKAGKKGVSNVVRAEMSKLITSLRTAINAIIKVVGVADVTGVYSYSFSQLKYLTRQLNSMLRQAADVAYYTGLAIGVVQGIQELIKWIASLPANIQKMLQACLANFTKSVKQVVNNINAIPNQVESSLKLQYSSFSNGLTQSINSIKTQINVDAKNQNPTLLNVLNGDSSTSALDELKKMMEPPSKEELLKSATKTTMQRP